MTHVLVIGGGGMVGQKLIGRLQSNGLYGQPVETISAIDLGFPDDQSGVNQIIGSLTEPAIIEKAAELKADVIYQLASIVSGEAERDFGKGWQVNLFGMWHLLEALRVRHENSGGAYRPRVVFTSSIATYGAPFPDSIDDLFLLAPQTSYGAQKACCEFILSDFSRKGFVEGVSMRLPTICVRPGKPNAAASSFFSGIIREPLNGQEAILPVPETVRHWHASPRSAARFLTYAAELDHAEFGTRPFLNLPGLSCTVEEQIEALRSIAGQEVVDLIKPAPDPEIMAIVKNWPENFSPERAVTMGFSAEQSFEEIIRVYIEDDLNHS